MKKLGVAAALCLVLAACGGGGDGGDGADATATESAALTGDEATAAENIQARLAKEGKGVAGTALSEEQTGCVADGVVTALGVERLQELGILSEDLKVQGTDIMGVGKLSTDEADDLAAELVECIEIADVLQQFAGASGLTEAQRTCINEAVDQDTLRTFLSETLQGESSQVFKDLQAPLVECLAP